MRKEGKRSPQRPTTGGPSPVWMRYSHLWPPTSFILPSMSLVWDEAVGARVKLYFLQGKPGGRMQQDKRCRTADPIHSWALQDWNTTWSDPLGFGKTLPALLCMKYNCRSFSSWRRVKWALASLSDQLAQKCVWSSCTWRPDCSGSKGSKNSPLPILPRENCWK